MTDQERAALELIAHDAGQGAEDRNAALRALGELPPLPADAAELADEAGQGAE